MVRAGRAAEGADKSPTRDPKVWRVAAAGALLAVPQFGVVAFFVIFLHEERGFAVGTAAGFLAAVQLLGGAARILVGRWSDSRCNRIGPLRKLGLATTLGLVVTSALVGTPDPVLLPALLATSILAASWNGLANTVAAELAAPGRPSGSTAPSWAWAHRSPLQPSPALSQPPRRGPWASSLSLRVRFWRSSFWDR
jgi:predicted MFS family arabinose efflux permease